MFSDTGSRNSRESDLELRAVVVHEGVPESDGGLVLGAADGSQLRGSRHVTVEHLTREWSLLGLDL